ncbi:hypothetical protein Ssi02_31520 [Sinosporangium siamense]|uniref:Uncharacterized protein n=1 Tax=Sinosporangium siamense TaxID=1367973 RepID=A0A919RJ27_9ACTN|nr:hypothetical protein Ssi02_31520 [Sinosporangium siamense]
MPDGSGGFQVVTKPWPAMLRTPWGDYQRFIDTYGSRFADQGYYFAGDGSREIVGATGLEDGAGPGLGRAAVGLLRVIAHQVIADPMSRPSGVAAAFRAGRNPPFPGLALSHCCPRNESEN